MRTEIITKSKPFSPVTIEITFESQEELDSFGSACNHSALSDAVMLPDYETMERAGANVGGVTAISDAIAKHHCMKDYFKKSTP